ncbi:MAG: acyl-CoA dehydratase activase [Fibrobacterota bacterium]
MKNATVQIGIDVGSTTVKTVVLENQTIQSSAYKRHGGQPLKTLIALLEEILQHRDTPVYEVAFTGSQSSEYARALTCLHVQEVIAGSVAVQNLYPRTKTAIELGGQDAKILFFNEKDAIKDMRMNGVCAGGTGAFIDQTASLLNIPVEEFNSYAEGGTREYEISGRCGVFAKTDIQPLLNQGIPREDLAYSCLHALAKQTIGGLAQGMELNPPILLSGGPFYFIPLLRKIFKERLHLTDTDVIVPSDAQTLIAYGTASCLNTSLNHTPLTLDRNTILQSLNTLFKTHGAQASRDTQPFFTSQKEQETFYSAYADTPPLVPPNVMSPHIRVYLGIDAGSTTTKFVALSEDKHILHTFYKNNQGAPLKTLKEGMLDFFTEMDDRGTEVHIAGVGTTGYGEELFAAALKADYHTVETMAHKEAACFYEPRTDFILDLGGQDMKALFLKNGVITDIVLNEACSAGCGSFIESFSNSVGITPENIAARAFSAKHPPSLGSRCTVFMNSSIISEQKKGHTTEDILAGLCRSVIENLFTKVIRINNTERLGKHIVVQGGTFKNDAVLKAFTDYIGRPVMRPPFPGEMGALGIALLTMKQHKNGKESTFIGREGLEKLTYTREEGNRCSHCSNHCLRTIITFTDGGVFVKGNRCPRGDIQIDRQRPLSHGTPVPDTMAYREKLLLSRKQDPPHPKKTIGIPLVLDFYTSLPFWETLFTHLGYAVRVSGKSSYALFESGLRDVPSDTACFPAKLVHGHLRILAEKNVDCIFFPAMLKNLPEYPENMTSWNCAVLQGYPEISQDKKIQRRDGKHIPLLTPSFKWTNKRLYRKQITAFLSDTFNESPSRIKTAICRAEKELQIFRDKLREYGDKTRAYAKKHDRFAVVLAARPYHGDSLVNHRISSLFTALNIPVLIPEALPVQKIKRNHLRIDLTNNYHTLLIQSTQFVLHHSDVELVQLVSFGCGHDAVYSDEISRLLRGGSHKIPLILKIDESDNPGPLKIRIKSFVESVTARRTESAHTRKKLPRPFERIFEKQDTQKTILVPNLSPSFSVLLAESIRQQGYSAEVMPLADRKAIGLGKKYVHNDICFPAQINIGEHIHWLRNNPEKVHSAAVIYAKNCQDCRAGHYAALARKALDDAGFSQVPLATTDLKDTSHMHPGFRLNTLKFNSFNLRGLALIDALDDLLLKSRPYEINTGQAEKLHIRAVTDVIKTLRKKGFSAALKRFDSAVEDFNTLETDRQSRKPRVGIIGEILVNFHPSANYGIAAYLEEQGMEVVLPNLIEFWHQEAINWQTMARKGHSRLGKAKKIQGRLYGKAFDWAIEKVEKHKRPFKYYEPHSDIAHIAEKAEEVMDISYKTGEGWLIPGEILSWAEEGVNSFLILQPFGCLPNHITGKGLMKRIKQRHEDITLMTLDFDPDTSLANIHNRLQMLILHAK